MDEMTEKRFIRTIGGSVLDIENDKFYSEDCQGEPLDCEDEVVALLNQLHNENKQLKEALREELEENGNAYCIELLDKIFDLNYDEWQRKMNETHTYDYIDWEKVLKDKGDVE